MSAARLREAAALMRERAKAAEYMLASPWNVGPEGANGGGPRDGFSIGYATDNPLAGLVATCADYVPLDAADHIASWHPAVALAVADWLEAVASEHEVGDSGNATIDAFFADFNTADDIAAVAVANAYLGKD